MNGRHGFYADGVPMKLNVDHGPHGAVTWPNVGHTADFLSFEW